MKPPKNTCRIHKSSPITIWIPEPPHWGCPGCNAHNPIIYLQPVKLELSVSDLLGTYDQDNLDEQIDSTLKSLLKPKNG